MVAGTGAIIGAVAGGLGANAGAAYTPPRPSAYYYRHYVNHRYYWSYRAGLSK